MTSLGDRSRDFNAIERFRFKANSFIMIDEMGKLMNMIPVDTSALIDEMLHGILFLGRFRNKTSLSPQDIFETQYLEALQQKYPRPFDTYRTHLPKRSPFSCMLDMIVLQQNPENEEQIKQSLQGLCNSLEERELVSTTMCISQIRNSPARYYGVSMSVTGHELKEIVIAASCLRKWHEYVSDAVMTYFPGKVKRNYFDGTINVPENVRCEAFNIKSGKRVPPCILCCNLFCLQGNNVNSAAWPYGNCAEAESLSNLLMTEEEVRNEIRPHPANNRQRAKTEVQDHLTKVLKNIAFDTWNNEFYDLESRRYIMK